MPICFVMYMSSTDSLDQTIRAIDAFTKERDWEQFHSLKNLMASVSIEASELNETLQWSNPSTEVVCENPELIAEIADELADVMAYCLRICSVLDLEPVQIIQKKIEKNRLKYPVEISKGSSAKYTAYEK